MKYLYSLINTSNTIKREFKNYLETKINITYTQWIVLKQIKTNPGISGIEISKNVGQDKVTIADVVNRLTTKGMITKEKSSVDKRKSVLRISDSAESLCSKIKDYENDFEKVILKDFTEEELNALDNIINKINSNLEENNG